MLIIGAVLFFSGQLSLPANGLRGDIIVETEWISFSFPLGTALLIAVLATILLDLVIRLIRK